MSGIFHSLNIGAESLYATRQGIDTTAHNIANAQTEGYSRQSVKLLQRDPIEKHGIIIGDGVYVGTIARAHDKFIERQINQAGTLKGTSETKYAAMHDLEGIFSPELSASIADEMSNFFTALHNLSKFPEELTTRTAAQEQGKNLAEGFRRVDTDLRRQREGLNDYINITTSEVNQRLASIATLNTRIREMEVGPRNQANDLRDQRDTLVRELSQLIDLHYYEDKDGMVMIYGPAQMLLVERGHNATFDVKVNYENDSLFNVVVLDYEGKSARDVTKYLEGGKLSALVDVRDHTAKHLIERNNEMAKTFVDRFNEVHRQGFGIEEYGMTNGRNFFKPLDSLESAAREMQLDTSVLGSVQAISAASIGDAPGDNVNANRLIRVQSEQLFGGGTTTLNEYYANYVSILGTDAIQAKHATDSDEIIFSDLRARREAVAGVSLDEEAANMIRWQTAFTASSKVITTVDEMLETILNLKR